MRLSEITKQHDTEEIMPPKAHSYAIGKFIGMLFLKHKAAITFITVEVAGPTPSVEFTTVLGMRDELRWDGGNILDDLGIDATFYNRTAGLDNNERWLFRFKLQEGLDEPMVRKGLDDGAMLDPPMSKRVTFI